MPTETPAIKPAVSEVPQTAGRPADWKSSWIWWVGVALVPAAVLALYWPTLHAGFLTWDDDAYLLTNPRVLAADGLTRIWITMWNTPDWPNYPLYYTSFWLENRLWGLNATAFHASNVALHALNALLVLVVLRRLGLSRAVAWISALLFALHPVQVESAAWITERKNVLSGVFYLLAFLFYRMADEGAPRPAGAGDKLVRRPVLYALALLAFIAALLGKTTTVTLIPTLFLADCLLPSHSGRTPREAAGLSLKRLVPFVIVGIIACLMLMGVEGSPLSDVPLAVRPLIAARAVWFYAGKLLLPVGLIPIYPRWDLNPALPGTWLPLLAVVLAIFAVWRWRTTLGGAVVWGIGHFLATLLPAIGLVSFGYHSHSFVADRFVYLACIGFFVAIVADVERALRAWRGGGRAAAAVLPVAGGLAAVALGILTARQIPVWYDSYRLWTTAVQTNPDSWFAQHGCAQQLAFRGRYEEALAHWRRCVELQPNFLLAHLRIGQTLAAAGDLAGAEAHLREALKQAPQFPPLRIALADVRAARSHVPEAIQMLRELAGPTGGGDAAERLAWILATSPVTSMRRGAEAVQLAERAVRATFGAQAQPLDTLAAAYAETGQFNLAIETAIRALAAAERDGDAVLAEQIRGRLRSYRESLPIRGSGSGQARPLK